jgi:hypothetical protein
MSNLNISELLSSAISPVTLITGVSFLTSIMTPRFGRCIDRIRTLLGLMGTTTPDTLEFKNYFLQLQILYQRTRILRNTMTAAGICIFFVVITIASTFANLFISIPSKNFPVTCFILSLISLLFLTFGFTYDFIISLKAVRLEIESSLHPLNQKLGAQSYALKGTGLSSLTNP